MIKIHFGIKQMKIGESMGVIHSFAWNYIKYTNMEGFCRQSHIITVATTLDNTVHAYTLPIYLLYISHKVSMMIIGMTHQ